MRQVPPRVLTTIFTLALLLPQASANAQQPLPETPTPIGSLASLSGSVADADGDVIPGARVRLHVTSPVTADLDTVTSPKGLFNFDHLSPQPFTLTVVAKGFSPTQSSGLLHAAETLQLPTLRLTPATSDSISVAVTRQELAAAELRVEEKQKILGFIPNYYVAYDWHAPPLSSRQKWQLAWADLTDADNILIGGGIAGVQQAANALPGYHQGTEGYLKRFGSDYAGLAVNTALTGAALPILCHQDPRYFYKGSGSGRLRSLYALSTAVVARGDNGRRQPAYASVLGNFAAGAASNLFYARSDRDGFQGILTNGAFATALDAVTNLLQEFFIKRLTPNAPTYSPPNP